MMALMPRSPRCTARSAWSSTGYMKHSVLPDPVPVVTMVLSGRRSLADRRCHACHW